MRRLRCWFIVYWDLFKMQSIPNEIRTALHSVHFSNDPVRVWVRVAEHISCPNRCRAIECVQIWFYDRSKASANVIRKTAFYWFVLHSLVSISCMRASMHKWFNMSYRSMRWRPPYTLHALSAFIIPYVLVNRAPMNKNSMPMSSRRICC